MNMEALKIAFETIIIGALALPWLVVAIQLFFPVAKDWLLRPPSFGKDEIQSALAGVLLVALRSCTTSVNCSSSPGEKLLTL
jgi:hypothetical protein